MAAMVSASSLLLLLLVAPPFSSAALFRPSPYTGKFVAQGVRSILKQSYKSYKDYLKDSAQQGGPGFPGRSNNQDDHQLGSSAADSYGAFTFDLTVGTQTLSVVMDITSELVWTQCGKSCSSCPVFTTPTFLPPNNPDDSFAPIGCDDPYCRNLFPDEPCADTGGGYCGFMENFVGGGYTSGYLANAALSFGTTASPSMVFGCSDKFTVPDLALVAASGFVGFSRGPLSLVSQLSISSFSYFIASPDDPGQGSLSWSWGASAAAAPAPAMGSTPLLVPTANQNPSWYYVKLTGIEVDGQLLTTIPKGTFDVGTDGSGGVFLSTTVPITYLDQAAYSVLRMELLNRIQSQGVIPVSAADDPNHLCFLTQYIANAKVPKLALVFDGAGAAMELTAENYFFDYDGQTCLSILPSNGVSVLGSLLQVGRTMTYDIYADGSGLLTFETPAMAGAAAPAQAQVPLVIIIATALVASWGL